MIFDNVTHQFDDKFGRGARIINFSFSSELVTANTRPTRSILNGLSIIGSNPSDLCYHSG
jgi:hypothetical protein